MNTNPDSHPNDWDSRGRGKVRGGGKGRGGDWELSFLRCAQFHSSTHAVYGWPHYLMN